MLAKSMRPQFSLSHWVICFVRGAVLYCAQVLDIDSTGGHISFTTMNCGSKEHARMLDCDR